MCPATTANKNPTANPTVHPTEPHIESINRTDPDNEPDTDTNAKSKHKPVESDNEPNQESNGQSNGQPNGKSDHSTHAITHINTNEDTELKSYGQPNRTANNLQREVQQPTQHNPTPARHKDRKSNSTPHNGTVTKPDTEPKIEANRKPNSGEPNTKPTKKFLRFFWSCLADFFFLVFCCVVFFFVKKWVELVALNSENSNTKCIFLSINKKLDVRIQFFHQKY